MLLLTDVFPPKSGGSGWSTYYLGKALKDRGHEVSVVRPRFDSGVAPGARTVEYGGITVDEITIPDAPGWTARLGSRKAWREAVARSSLSRFALARVREGRADVLHGGHAISAVAASNAARRARASNLQVVSVATVRDYWPLCPSSTRLFTTRSGRAFECRECHRLIPYLRCVLRSRGRRLQALPPAFARWLLTLRLGRTLGECDAVIAVSEYVRAELERSGRVPPARMVAIPNLVDLSSVDAALSSPWPLHDISPEAPFLLFAGKMDTNKGAQMLPDLVSRAGAGLPVVVAGDGGLREDIAREAGRLALDFRFYDWLDNDSVLLLMNKATALLFPSAWQEPLSRVLLEGLASGAAIVALDTGGTSDAVVHGESGRLASDAKGMAEGIRHVVEDGALNARLRAGARRRAEECFAAPVVSARVEALYRDLLSRVEVARA